MPFRSGRLRCVTVFKGELRFLMCVSATPSSAFTRCFGIPGPFEGLLCPVHKRSQVKARHTDCATDEDELLFP